MYTPKLKLNQFFILFLITLFTTSCVTKKDVVYFQNIKNFESIVEVDTFTAKLKIGDIVSVYVSTFNPEVAKPYNLIIESGGGGQMVDYLIDNEGNIDFPVLGKVQLLGLTVEEAKLLFKKKFEEGKLLKDPIIIIRILNYRIIVEGAVGAPGVYPISGERVSILEALSMAGGLTLKGRRDNVLVVRDSNGAKMFTRLDLTDKNLFNSPAYYLTQNDYIYVEPNNSEISTASGDRRITSILGLAGSVLGLALIFVSVN